MIVIHKLYEAADALAAAFVWAETPEGHAYWSQVHDRLLEMASEEDRQDK